jgi:hypothetical protein
MITVFIKLAVTQHFLRLQVLHENNPFDRNM